MRGKRNACVIDGSNSRLPWYDGMYGWMNENDERTYESCVVRWGGAGWKGLLGLRRMGVANGGWGFVVERRGG